MGGAAPGGIRGPVGTKGSMMTELDVELSRTVAAIVARRHGRWHAWAMNGTGAAAWTLLAASVVTVVLR